MVNYGGGQDFVSKLAQQLTLLYKDEVAALVVDIGTSSLRAGYAGDDTPKAVIPTAYGFHRVSRDVDVSMTDAVENGEARVNPRFSKIYVGSSGPSMWREGMEVANPVVEGLSAFFYLGMMSIYYLIFIVQDFEPIPHLIGHAFTKIMRCSPSDHPILVTEPSWNTQANRERMAEIMFEEFHVPAFYIANTGVLNAFVTDSILLTLLSEALKNYSFAAGKGSALVVDIGQSMASVTPVVDGFVLRKGSPRYL